VIAVPDESPPPGPAPGAPGEEKLPAPRGPLDRAALERVFARAAELQSSERDPADVMLTEEQIVEVGRDVGIAPEHVRQALAEERMRVTLATEEGSMARLFGGAVARAARTVSGESRRVLEALDSWMQQEECLQVKRAYGERIVWEERGGFLSNMRRGLNVGGRGYHLAKAREVSATVLQIDERRVLVRLEADLGNVRGERVAGGAGLVAATGTAAGVLLAIGVMPVLAIAPIVAGLGGGYLVARSHAPAVERAQLALEQVLDRMERGETPRGSLFSTLASSVRIMRF
jgi:hypothetical protein